MLISQVIVELKLPSQKYDCNIVNLIIYLTKIKVLPQTNNEVGNNGIDWYFNWNGRCCY
jgi:hypothetical protein